MQGQHTGAEIILIRHAPAAHGGRLCGRTDVAARLPTVAELAPLIAALGGVTDVICSPALRCRETAAALWPSREGARTDDRLWEQDFGAWEGRSFDQIPDIGRLSGDALAAHRPPGGESFSDVCNRVTPALRALEGEAVAVVAHAGVVRAGIAMAVGGPATALSFEVAPLSLTRLRRLDEGRYAVIATNWQPAP